jgi:rhodanese-related sulfurtransferase
MRASRTTWAMLANSAPISSANSAGVHGAGTHSAAPSRSRTTGSANAELISDFPYTLLLQQFGATRIFMEFPGLFEKYWPFMALVLWFSYKWWSSKRVLAMLPELMKNGAILVDVRSTAEFANGSAPGTINIPLQELGSRLGEIPKAIPVVLCCASGTRSGMAKLMLKTKGYQNVHNVGTWSKLLG